MRVASAILLAAATACVSATEPFGLASGVSRSGLHEFTSAILPALNGILGEFSSIPSITEPDLDTPVGHVTLDLTNIKAAGLVITELALTPEAPNKLSGTIAGLDHATISMDYNWRKNHWPHVKSSGSIDIYPGESSVEITVATAVEGGKPHVAAQSASVSFGHFEVKFHGDASWLYNILLDLLKGILKKAIEKAVTGAVENAVNVAGNKVLADLPTQLHIGGGQSTTDYSLTAIKLDVEGSGASSTAILALSMAATDELSHTACPLPMLPLPPLVAPTHYMLQAQLSPTVLSCALWSAYHNHALDLHISGANPPHGLPLPLNTSDWTKLGLPQLPAKYPNDLMTLNVTFSSGPPSLTASAAKGLVLDLPVVLDFGVLPKAGFLRGGLGGSTPVFALQTTASAGLDVSLVTERSNATGTVGPVLKFAVSTLAVDFKVLSSEVGDISVGLLNILTGLVTPVAKGIINSLGGSGFPIPSLGGLAFQNPAIEYGANVLAINTNITYTFPKAQGA